MSNPYPELDPFSPARGWTPHEGHPTRDVQHPVVEFSRDGGRVLVTQEGSGFVIRHRPRQGAERRWYAAPGPATPAGGPHSLADLLSHLDEAALMANLALIDGTHGIVVTDSHNQPGPWHHPLENADWSTALDWMAARPGASPTTEAAIAQLETDLRVRLPAAYREFLLRTGGAEVTATALFRAVRSPGAGRSVPEATELAREQGLFSDAVVIASNLLGGVDALDLRRGEEEAGPPVITFDPARFGLVRTTDLQDDEFEVDGTSEEADTFVEYLLDAVEVAAKIEAIEKWERARMQSTEQGE